MPAAVVEALIRARLQAFLDDTPPAFTVSLLPANMVASPSSDDEAFIVIQYPVVNGSKPVLNRHFQEEGGARIVINLRREIELEDALTFSDDIASLYRDRRLGSSLETYAPDTPIINDTSDDGNWFSLAVIVPYRFQFDDEDDEDIEPEPPPVDDGFPNAATTGVQDGITLSARGDWDINASGTYENMDVSGYVYINANDVTLKNCRVTAQPGQTGSVVAVATGKTGVVIEYCDIDGQSISGLKGVWLDVSQGTIVRYCDISASTDGVFMYGNDHYIHDNYIHDLSDVGVDPHMDCIQAGGNTGLVVEHNTLIGAADANACFAIGSNDGDLEITIDNNLMRPGPVMLFLINVGDNINVNQTVYHVINNHMEPGHVGSGNPYLTYFNNLPTTWTGNVDADTLDPIPPP